MVSRKKFYIKGNHVLSWLVAGAAVVAIASVGMGAGDLVQADLDRSKTSDLSPVLQTADLFAVIEDVQDDRLQMKMVHSAVSYRGL